MKKSIHLLVFIYLLSSCAGNIKTNLSTRKRIDKTFSGTFTNQSFTSNRKNQHSTILTLLRIPYEKVDSVCLTFTEGDKLLVMFYDGLTTKKETLEGRFRKRGDYEIYLRKKRFYIPIIYSSINVYRIRIASTVDHNLLIENLSEVSGNIFLLAGGYREKTRYSFKNQTKTP